MALLLNIETSTKVCSVSLALDGTTIKTIEEEGEQYIHSEKLTLFIEQLFNTTNYSVKDLSAVGVSRGPGSYTGLRIGVSAAKGLCYALNIPLLSVDSLEVLANLFSKENELKEPSVIYPMIDARRMEVFTKRITRTANDNNSEEIKAAVIDENYFKHVELPVYLFGDGADKFQDLFANNEQIKIIKNIRTGSSAMDELTYQRYLAQKHEDVAYFEPFYLKDFIAIPSKKNPLKVAK